jgi:hypothetical protein
VFEFLELDEAGLKRVVVGKHIEEEPGALVDFFCQFVEKIEEFFFSRDESHPL